VSSARLEASLGVRGTTALSPAVALGRGRRCMGSASSKVAAARTARAMPMGCYVMLCSVTLRHIMLCLDDTIRLSNRDVEHD
jgi:hypothetical protein